MSSPETRESLQQLGDREPVDMAGTTVETICAVVGASAVRGALGTIYLAIASWSETPVVAMDWSLTSIQSALPTYLADTSTHLAQLQTQVRLVTSPEDMVVHAEPSGLGQMIALEAQKSGHEVREIPEGVMEMTLQERAIAALTYLHIGKVKLARPAFEKTVNFRGTAANHLRRQIADYDRDQSTDDAELLTAFCNGILTAFGVE